jgi:hypothetical protein
MQSKDHDVLTQIKDDICTYHLLTDLIYQGQDPEFCR